MNSEGNVTQVVPFLRVSDIEESLAYYVYGLDFEVHNKWVEDGKLRWCWLTIGGGALMLQQFSKEGPDAWRPTGKLGEGVSIYFICEDALAIYRYATARGLPTTKPFVGNGMWVTSLSDPDGYEIIFESPTEDTGGE